MFLPQTKLNNFYLPKVQFHLASLAFLCRTPNSFVLKSDSCSFEITEMKRFSEDFRNNYTKVCKILSLNSICLIFPILLVACYCWKVENRYRVILVHASFGRCLSRQLQCILEIHQSRETSYVSLHCLLFKYRTWPNGEDGTHRYDSANKRRDRNSRRVNGDKNFNFITFD